MGETEREKKRKEGRRRRKERRGKGWREEEREKAKDSLRTGSRRTRLDVFGNGERNFVAENCYRKRPLKANRCLHVSGSHEHKRSKL